jgi:excisionase family DNA binding protein
MSEIKKTVMDVQKQMKAVAKANHRVDITTGEAAAIVGCAKQTIINYLDRGEITYTRMGRGARRVSVESLRNFLTLSGRSVPGFTDAESSVILDVGSSLKGITEESARQVLKRIIPVFNDKEISPKNKLKQIAKIIKDV